jgi:hypothetical protein
MVNVRRRFKFGAAGGGGTTARALCARALRANEKR